MKANEAPEKIYLDDSMSTDTAGELWSDALWFDTKVSDDSIEYVRKDAFIKKVINFLNYKLDDIVAIQNPDSIIPQHIVKPELIEDFKKYIEEYNV